MSMDESLSLRPRLKWVPWGFALFLTGAVTGLALGLKGESAGWIAALACAPLAAAFGLRFYPECHGLELTSEGFVVVRWFRPKEHAWTAVESIEVARQPMGKVVTIRFKPGLGGRITIAGEYQMSPDALATLMRRWQARCEG